MEWIKKFLQKSDSINQILALTQEEIQTASLYTTTKKWVVLSHGIGKWLYNSLWAIRTALQKVAC